VRPGAIPGASSLMPTWSTTWSEPPLPAPG